MPSSKEVREAEFSKSRNGYDQNEVDVFLDLIEEDYVKFEAQIASMSAKLDSLSKENESIKVSQSSIQTLLVSAQKLADEITENARVEAQAIIDDAKAKAQVIEHESQTRKIAAEQAAKQIIADAAKKSEGMITAAHDSVARQQILFDDLKAQIAQFKNSIKEKYKEHIELLAQIPDTVSSSAAEAAEAVKTLIEQSEDAADEDDGRDITDAVDAAVDTAGIAQEQADQNDTASTLAEGFQVNIAFEDEGDAEHKEENADDEIGFGKSKFFRRNK